MPHIKGTIEFDCDFDALAEEMEKSGYVKVVRCKDCKHRDPEDGICDCGHDILWQLPRDDNWFCADGERREDNED